MSKKILLSILMIVVVAALIGGATYALFSDSADAQFNGSTATLYLDQNSLVDFTLGPNAVPGWHTFRGGTDLADSSPWAVIVKNAGTISGKVTMDIADWSDAENGLVPPETALGDTEPDGELADNTLVTIYKDGTSFGPVPGTVVWGPGTVANLKAAMPLSLGTFAAGEGHAYVWKIEIPTTAGNDIQSDTLSFKAVYSLAQ
jgi:predicted ribosomally synthesized peptide with SipW-like signal peptide